MEKPSSNTNRPDVLATLPPAKQASLQRIRWVSYILDDAIPIFNTGYRMGLDPILGLLPGAGDGLSLLISIYLLLESLRFSLPKAILVRMIVNLIVDTMVGSVPVAGNVFDVVWKANRANVILLQRHLDNPQSPSWSDRLVLALVLWVIVLLVVGAIALIGAAIALLAWLLNL
jgi:hypothetical protein